MPTNKMRKKVIGSKKLEIILIFIIYNIVIYSDSRAYTNPI